MTRRIVQIATTDTRVYMLCNDGTAWERTGGEYYRIDDIPQDEPAVDPIAEIEKLEGFLIHDSHGFRWSDYNGKNEETIPSRTGVTLDVAGLRAAAARLLERVRGENS